jgi:hypothetical protein
MTRQKVVQLGLGHSLVVVCPSLCRAMTRENPLTVPFAGSLRVGSVLKMALWMISWAYIMNVLMAPHSCPQGSTGPEDEASLGFFVRTALTYLDTSVS